MCGKWVSLLVPSLRVAGARFPKLQALCRAIGHLQAYADVGPFPSSKLLGPLRLRAASREARLASRIASGSFVMSGLLRFRAAPVADLTPRSRSGLEHLGKFTSRREACAKVNLYELRTQLYEVNLSHRRVRFRLDWSLRRTLRSF